ncbi:unnamed protein product [Leptosia nina]|uniref:Uncharacterized protein n=1 Tax=Leptosia nina TaxID=320188 RepID=A0AAV1K482_9NEOP
MTEKAYNLRESTEESLTNTAQLKEDGPQDDDSTESTTSDNPNEKPPTKDRIQNKEFNVVERDPMFVIVDSSCQSNPSSREMLINNNKTHLKETELPKYLKKYVLPIDLPSTSKEIREPYNSSCNETESREELQVIDINLQSDNELPVKHYESEREDESIVIAYLKNKHRILGKDGQLLSSKKKSSLLSDLPKLETIPESEQSTAINASLKLSENSLDVHIPSYPCSPRSLDFGSGHSYNSEYEDQRHDPRLKEAIEFLHADKDLLIAAETGNDPQIDMILRRKDMDIQQMDHLGRNALHLAVCSDNLRAIELLLKAGVNPNVKDSVGMTPLSLSLFRRPSLTVAKLLFNYGAKIMPRSDPMDTGLFIQFVMMSSPTSEEENIMELLIEKGALVNDPDAPGGRQALHFAAMSNNSRLIRILVQLGAQLYYTNHRNETPRDTAFTFNCTMAYELLTEMEEYENDNPPVHITRRRTSYF